MLRLFKTQAAGSSAMLRDKKMDVAGGSEDEMGKKYQMEKNSNKRVKGYLFFKSGSSIREF